jgi:hypothetical protein
VAGGKAPKVSSSGSGVVLEFGDSSLAPPRCRQPSGWWRAGGKNLYAWMLPLNVWVCGGKLSEVPGNLKGAEST